MPRDLEIGDARFDRHSPVGDVDVDHAIEPRETNDDAAGDRLYNCWINEHDVAHLAGCTPVLIMDVFEHAYMTDYQLKRADYIEAFFANVNWKAVESRLK